MEEKQKSIVKWLFWFSLAVVIIILYKTLDSFGAIMNWFTNLFHIIAPFIMGILLAYIFYIPVKNTEKIYNKVKFKWFKKRARTFSVITVYILALILIVLIFRFIVPTIINSVIELVNNIPNYYKIAIEKVNEIPNNNILNSDDVKNVIKNIENIDLKSMLNFNTIVQYLKNVVGFARGIFDIFVTLMVSLYILIDRKSIIKFLNRFTKATFNEHKYEIIKYYFKKSNEIFFKFLYSQILDGFIVGILTSIIMLILRVKYAVLLGFLIGIFNLIPYFGAIVAVGFAILITIFTGGINQAIWVAICVIIMQQIDANIINPKIVGNSLKMSSLLVIFAITIFGAYFGVLGMFLAVPIMAIIKTILENYINDRLEKKQQTRSEYTPIEFDEEFKEKDE